MWRGHRDTQEPGPHLAGPLTPHSTRLWWLGGVWGMGWAGHVTGLPGRTGHAECAESHLYALSPRKSTTPLQPNTPSSTTATIPAGATTTSAQTQRRVEPPLSTCSPEAA